MTQTVNKAYLRYSDDKKVFIQECYDQAEYAGVLMTDKLAKQIWDDLQKMEEPQNFTFSIPFKKYQLISTK